MLNNLFRDGYKDQLPNAGKGTPPAGFNPHVSSYTTWGLSGTYTGLQATRPSRSASRTCSTATRRSPRTTSTKSSAPAGTRAWPTRVAVR
jgi:hypothetical protein